jgi:hypothetical protein
MMALPWLMLLIAVVTLRRLISSREDQMGLMVGKAELGHVSLRLIRLLSHQYHSTGVGRV